MKQKVMYGLGLMLCVLLLCGSVPVEAAKSKVNGSTSMEELKQFRPVVDSCYSFSVEHAFNVSISNKETTDTGVVYMEYEVGEVKEDTSYQMAILNASTPSVAIMGGVGKSIYHYRNFEREAGCEMLVPGAQYYICFAQRADKLEFYVQRTINGVVELMKFPDCIGSYDKAFEYFTLFFGEGRNHWISAEFKNFRCYDGNGKDLGIQLDSENAPLVEITQKGLMDDTSLFEGGYYCADKPELGLIVLGKDFEGYQEVDGKLTAFSYDVYGNGGEPATLYLKYEDGKTVWNYSYLMMLDESGNKFKKLQNAKVTFVVGDDTTVQDVTVEDGYRIKEPENPTKLGDTFLGWYLGNDEKYEFDSIVDESITLYARWEGDGHDYITAEQLEVRSSILPILIGIGGFVLIIGVSVGVSILIRRRKQHAKK